MEWIREITTTEIAILAGIISLGLLFVIRTILKAKKLKHFPYLVFFKVILRTSYITLLFIALLGPSFGKTEQEVKSIAKDIYIAVDLSNSMNATDVQPSRIEKVKFELKKIIGAFKGDKIGLMIFSSEAFVQCPITFDYNALNMFLESLSTGLVPNTGTDIAQPLKLALSKHLSDESSKNSAKIILLISDGEDFSESTKSIAKDITDNDIKLFALGVGTENGSRIPYKNGFKKDQDGNEVVTKLNSESLKTLASLTGGRYFEITDKNNEVEKLINSIKKIKGQLRDSKKIDVSANKYSLFLLPALLLMLIDVLFKINVLKV